MPPKLSNRINKTQADPREKKKQGYSFHDVLMRYGLSLNHFGDFHTYTQREVLNSMGKKIKPQTNFPWFTRSSTSFRISQKLSKKQLGPKVTFKGRINNISIFWTVSVVAYGKIGIKILCNSNNKEMGK